MSNTFPGAFVFENIAAVATITATSSLPATPPSLLQTQQVGNRWCAQTDTVALTIALNAAYSFDFVGLYGTNLGLTATTRIRASLLDSTALAGEVFDTGSVVGAVNGYYGTLAALRSAPVLASYLRIDMTQPAIARIMGGFLMIGLSHQLTVNFARGFSDTPVDPSIKTRARAQSIHIDPRTKRREWNFSCDFLTETERFGWVEDLDKQCGTSQNIVFIRDCSSSNLSRDAMLGLIEDGPPTISRDGFINDLPTYSKAYKIVERNAPYGS